MNEALILLLLGRLPLYGYVFYRAWKFRKSAVVISSFWLGALALSAMASATASALSVSALNRNLIGFSVAISMFMLALTARELKVKK